MMQLLRWESLVEAHGDVGRRTLVTLAADMARNLGAFVDQDSGGGGGGGGGGTWDLLPVGSSEQCSPIATSSATLLTPLFPESLDIV